MKKWDIGLLAGLLLAAVMLFVVFRMNEKNGDAVIVRIGSEIKAAYSLYENREVVIEGRYGGSNTLRIENGTAYLLDATCPDKLCVRQGMIEKQGQSIICLPNEVVIEIHGEENEKENEYDVIAK